VKSHDTWDNLTIDDQKQKPRKPYRYKASQGFLSVFTAKQKFQALSSQEISTPERRLEFNVYFGQNEQ
jgi:hypothetical protein